MNQIITGGTLPDAERARVERIRKAIAAGTYEISSEVVAVKLVRLMSEIDNSPALHGPSSSSEAKLHGGARSDKKRERDLHDGENAPAMLRASSDNANLSAGEHTRAIVARKTQGGDKTVEDAAEQRQRDGEREDGADVAPATGADRTAATGQQRDGAIGSPDDEQQHNASKKKRAAPRSARITW